MKLTFPDGNVREYPQGTTGMDIAMSISEGLARNALGIFLNGKKYDLRAPLNEDGDVKIVTFDDEEGKEIYWHSSAHLMAEAIQEMYPGVKFGIGPPIENGFYYDIDLPEGKRITQEDLPKIEAKMRELIAQDLSFDKSELTSNEAIQQFNHAGQSYKAELIEDLKAAGEEKVSIYTILDPRVKPEDDSRFLL
jgi:threonyl-tRNA synthetase